MTLYYGTNTHGMSEQDIPHVYLMPTLSGSKYKPTCSGKEKNPCLCWGSKPYCLTSQSLHMSLASSLYGGVLPASHSSHFNLAGNNSQHLLPRRLAWSPDQAWMQWPRKNSAPASNHIMLIQGTANHLMSYSRHEQMLNYMKIWSCHMASSMNLHLKVNLVRLCDHLLTFRAHSPCFTC